MQTIDIMLSIRATDDFAGSPPLLDRWRSWQLERAQSLRSRIMAVKGDLLCMRLIRNVIVCATITVTSVQSAQAQLKLADSGVRLGELDGSGALTDPRGLVVDSAAIYVLEPRDAIIRVFDKTGQFVRTIGRRGMGPGEFALPYAVHMSRRGNGLLVVDQNTQRLTAIAPDGTVRFSRALPSVLAGFRLFQHRPLGNNGSLIVLGDRTSSPDSEQREIIIVKPDSTIHSIRSVSIATRTLIISNPRNPRFGQINLRSPFASHPIFIVNPSAERFVIIDRNDPARARIVVYDTLGRIIRAFEHLTRPVPFPRAARAVYIDTVAAGAARSGFFHSADDARPVIAKLLPQELPSITEAVFTDDETLWLRGPDDQVQPTVRWHRRDAVGRPAGYVDLARTSRVLLSRGNEIFVLERGELDVPYVHKYLITGL